jgi:hypothetical protein
MTNPFIEEGAGPCEAMQAAKAGDRKEEGRPLRGQSLNRPARV